MTDARVVITWKILVRPEEFFSSDEAQVQVQGRGWVVFHCASANGDRLTNVQAVARFSPSSKLHEALTLDHVQQNAELGVLIDFVTSSSKGYAAFASPMRPMK